MKKVPQYWHGMAVKALKQANELVTIQKDALKVFKEARSFIKGSQVKSEFARGYLQMPKEITGRVGRRNLNRLKKERIDLAIGARLSEGRLQLGKLKWNQNLLKNLSEQTKRRTWNYDRWSSSGARADFLKEAAQDLAIHKKAKAQVVDRVINARGKGIRFVKRNGRIIPIRKK